MNEPDKWMVIKINGDTPHYKIFASWYGGFTDGDSWRMNSGITGVEKDGEFYVVKGASGSVYHCHEKAYGIHAYGSGVLDRYIDMSSGLIEKIDEMPDMLNTDWLLK